MESLILNMPKRMDASELSGMRKAMNKAFASSADLIILNFERCEFMDSLGLSVIVTGLKTSAKTGKRFRLANVGKEIRLLLQITRFDRICDIHDSLESALG